MKTANDITKAYNEAYRKDNDLIFFLLGGTVSNFLEEQYKKAKEGYAGLTCRSVKKWEDRDKEVWLSDHYPICTELEWINL